MVDKFIRIGQNEDILGYDDADYRGGIEVDDTIICQDGVQSDEAITVGQGGNILEEAYFTGIFYAMLFGRS